MGKKSREERRRVTALQERVVARHVQAAVQADYADSLLAEVEDGKEYTSIVDKKLRPGTNVLDDVSRGIAEIERLRGRPCIAYIGNVVKKDEGESSIDSSDDLPFREMVAQVPAAERHVDVLVATRGGSAHQVSNFVNCLRARFDQVDFLIPSFCMSAGTLFALSGDHIWMTDRACLGPIDPQVPTKEGRYVPAQALLLLVAEIQRQGDEAMRQGLPVPWAAVRVIDSLDKKELGEALTASQYSQTMATQFLSKYKFRNWIVRETSRTPVTDADRLGRAGEIALALVSHDRWKSHGHAISRDVLWQEVQLRIDHPDPALDRAIIRLWAVLTWIFDKTPIVKLPGSSNYRYVRHVIHQIIGPMPR